MTTPREPSPALRLLQRIAHDSRWEAAQRGAEPIHGTPRTEGEWRFEGTRCVARPEETVFPCGIPATADVLGRVVREHVTCPLCIQALRGGE
jgi:hypothetical protein